ncbi:MAG: hypothetical protein IT365_23610 [Candidatus Hydrogenedentes bacterium]|nr:hypothetical protein [Candidatus Hydrogenedentota bacterium]
MGKIKAVSRIPIDGYIGLAAAYTEVFWLGNPLTHYKECLSHETTLSGKKECYQAFVSEKSEG